jgi:hypothetical protein
MLTLSWTSTCAEFTSRKAIANIEHIPAGFEALIFSIYSVAVLSLTDNDCEEIFG